MASLWLKPIYSPNVFCQILFIWPIRQTLTPPNIPVIRYMRLLMITVCLNLEVYCEAVQSGRYSQYDLASDHVLAHPWSCWHTLGHTGK